MQISVILFLYAESIAFQHMAMVTNIRSIDVKLLVNM